MPCLDGQVKSRQTKGNARQQIAAGTIKELMYFYKFTMTIASSELQNKHQFYLNKTSEWFPDGAKPAYPLILVETASDRGDRGRDFDQAMAKLKDGALLYT